MFWSEYDSLITLMLLCIILLDKKKNVLLKENKRNRIRTAKGTGNG